MNIVCKYNNYYCNNCIIIIFMFPFYCALVEVFLGLQRWCCALQSNFTFFQSLWLVRKSTWQFFIVYAEFMHLSRIHVLFVHNLWNACNNYYYYDMHAICKIECLSSILLLDSLFSCRLIIVKHSLLLNPDYCVDVNKIKSGNGKW